MSYDNGRSSESGDGLHRHCFAEVRFFKWQQDEVSVSLRAKSGSYGGGSEVLVVDVLPFDTTQITSDKNWSHPRFGDPCHPLAANQHPPPHYNSDEGRTMWKGINGDVAETLDAHYYLGCGNRGGREREVVYWVNDELPESDRNAFTRSASGELQRPGCV